MKKTVERIFYSIMIFAILIHNLIIVSGAGYDYTKYKIQGRDLQTGDYIISAINVRDFGAKGDGVTDDTYAFEDAIAFAGMSNGKGAIVYVPAGKYRLTQDIFIYSGVTLRGQWKNPDQQNSGNESVLYADIQGGNIAGRSFIEMGNHSSIRDMNIYYPRQAPEGIIEYPYTIKAQGHVVSIQNVTLINSYRGIDAGGQFAGSAHNISNIYGTILNQGIRLDWNYEVSQIVNVNFKSKYWAEYSNVSSSLISNYTKNNCTAIMLGKVDDVFIYNLNIDNREFKSGVRVYYNEAIPNPPKIAYGLLIKLNGAQITEDTNPDISMPDLYQVDQVPGSDAYSHTFSKDRYPAKTEIYNVRLDKYGAKGDGVSDDTNAILKAITDAKNNGGGTIFLPSGKYKISNKITIPENTELRGEWDSPHLKSPTEILMYYGRNKENEGFITLSKNSGVHGITFRIPELLPENIVPYSWIIKAAGEFTWVEYISIINSYNAINFYDNKNDNFLIKGVWGTAMNKGIAVGGGSVNGRMEFNMLTFGAWWEDIGRTVKLDDYTYKNTTGYIFGNASNISGISNSEFGLKYGIVFQSQDGGIPKNISLFRSLLDNPFGEASLHLKAGSDLSFIGLSTGVHTGKLIIAEETFNGRARIFGQNLWGGADNLLRNKNIQIYDSSSTNVDIINHNFKFVDGPKNEAAKPTLTVAPTMSQQPSPTPIVQPTGTGSVDLTPGTSSELISGEQSESQGDETPSDTSYDSTESSNQESSNDSDFEDKDENSEDKSSGQTVFIALLIVFMISIGGVGVTYILKKKNVI